MVKMEGIEEELAKAFDIVDLSKVSTQDLMRGVVRFSHPSIVKRIKEELKKRWENGQISEWSPLYPGVKEIIKGE